MISHRIKFYICYFEQLPELDCVFCSDGDITESKIKEYSHKFMKENLKDFLGISISRINYNQANILCKQISIDEIPEKWRNVLIYHDIKEFEISINYNSELKLNYLK